MPQHRLSGDISVSRTRLCPTLNPVPCPARSDSDPVACGPCHLAQSECPSWVYNSLARGSTTPSMSIRPLKKSFLSPWPVMITQHFFQNISERGVGEPGMGGCNPPPEEHRSSRWLLLRATVVIAFPVVSSDLAQAASVFRNLSAWAKAPPTPCVIRSHSPCLLATLAPCIRSLGPAFRTLAARPASCLILGPALCSGLRWPARGPLPGGDGTWGGRVRCCSSSRLQ